MSMSTRRVALGLGLFLSLLVGCASTSQGAFHAQGPEIGEWDLRPDACASGMHAGYFGAALYRRDPSQDTELVVVKRFDGIVVLARAPNRKQMIVFRKRDCRVLDADVHLDGITVDDVASVEGSLRLDCDKEGVGHVEGEARFLCL